MEDKDILRIALEMLDWSPDDLERELNREVTGEGQRLSRSTIYRWLSGTSPINVGVKAYLREKISRLGLLQPIAPKESTKVLVTGPSGCGVSPLSYEIAGCIRKIGVDIGIVEPEDDTSLWRGIALGEHVGADITSHQTDFGQRELLLEDRKDISRAFMVPEERKKAEAAIGSYDGLLLIGEGNDIRMKPYADICRFAVAEGVKVAAVACIHPHFGVPCRLWNDLKDIGVNTAVFLKPHTDMGMDLFKRCLNPNIGQEDPVTQHIWPLAYLLLETLGWPEDLVEDTGNVEDDYTLSLGQIVRSHRLSHRGGRIPRLGV